MTALHAASEYFDALSWYDDDTFLDEPLELEPRQRSHQRGQSNIVRVSVNSFDDLLADLDNTNKLPSTGQYESHMIRDSDVDENTSVASSPVNAFSDEITSSTSRTLTASRDLPLQKSELTLRIKSMVIAEPQKGLDEQHTTCDNTSTDSEVCNSPFYDLNSTLYDGTKFSFDACRNKVVLIVNIASFCALRHQLDDLTILKDKYKSQGFEIVGFLSNSFLQEPLNSRKSGLKCTSKHSLNFPLMEKVKVNGSKASPVYKHLKNSDVPERIKGLPRKEGNYRAKDKFNKSVRWNYEKFLVDKHGDVIRRFSPIVKPLEISPFIEELL